MVHILTGRSGSGKSKALLEEIKRNIEKGIGEMLVIVPEQQTYALERELGRVCGPSAPLYAEVLNFKSLAREVFAREGGLASERINDAGRMLNLRLAAESCREELTVYGGCLTRPELLEKLSGALKELKNCRVSSGELLEASLEASEPLKSKLHDLHFLLLAYDALLQKGGRTDPCDDMQALALLLKNGYLKNKRIYIDGFNGYTPGELGVLGEIFATAEECFVTLCCDRLDPTAQGLFAHTAATAADLIKLLERRSIAYREIRCTHSRHTEGSDLWLVERGLFDYTVKPSLGQRDESVRFMSAPSVYAECELVASEIVRLVRDEGFAPGSIAIAARDLSMYAQTLLSVFSRWEIPLFLDRADPALSKLPVRVIVSAMTVCSGKGRTEDLIRLAKSGIAGITAEQADLLENYAEINGLRLRDFFRPFTAHPDGLGHEPDEESDIRLAELESARRSLCDPLAELKASGGSATSVCGGIYRYMESIGLSDGIERLALEAEAVGDGRSAGIYRALWDDLCGVLDQCVFILGDEVVDIPDFAPLFSLVLSRTDTASIPPTLDAVQAGEVGRMRLSSPEAVFVIGAADGILPPGADAGGIFTSDERRFLLQKGGIAISPPDEDSAFFEQLIAYQTFAAPSKRLYISCPENRSGGEKTERSYLMQRAMTLLPGFEILSPDSEGLYRCAAVLPCMTTAARSLSGEGGRVAASALEALKQRKEDISRLNAASDPSRGPLTDPEVIDGLFGGAVSPTRMEQFYACRFAHFAKYGLRLKPLRQPDLGAADIGTFIHYVLENTAADAKASGADWRSIDRQALLASGDRHAREYIERFFGKDRSLRMDFILKRLISRVRELLISMADEFAAGLFAPYEFEMNVKGEFSAADGSRLVLAGKLDRVDIWQDGERRYIRVVDYKTGDKKFEYTDLKNGLSVQLLIYLFAVVDRIPGSLPAGAMYIPSLGGSAKVPPGASEEKKLEAALDRVRRSGVVLEDEKVLLAMEDSQKPRFIPVGYNKDGSLKKASSAISAAEFGRLRSHLEGLVEQMSAELKKGLIECNPYEKTKGDGCEWCDYKAVCRFDPSSGHDTKRKLKSVTKAEFYGRE